MSPGFRKTLRKVSRPGAFALLLCLIMVTAGPNSIAEEAFSGDQKARNYTHLRFQNNPDNFQFAVIGDNSGGARAGVLHAAVDALNLLRPDFVLGVGDLIEGYTDDENELKRQWQEMDDLLGQLAMPFFFVPGNHDVNFDPSENVWFQRAGAKRSYSHFVYKDVLFLLLSTEDPPKREATQELLDKYASIKEGKVTGEEAMAIVEELEAWAGAVSIADPQVEYFRDVLAANPEARWTFVFMHSPAWTQADPANFVKIEALLADRPYTLLAGHTHTYNYTVRNGRDYITMATTGGLAPPHGGAANMDHLAWISMSDEGPVIGNLLLNGVLDKEGAGPVLEDFLMYRPR